MWICKWHNAHITSHKLGCKMRRECISLLKASVLVIPPPPSPLSLSLSDSSITQEANVADAVAKATAEQDALGAARQPPIKWGGEKIFTALRKKKKKTQPHSHSFSFSVMFQAIMKLISIIGLWVNKMLGANIYIQSNSEVLKGSSRKNINLK